MQVDYLPTSQHVTLHGVSSMKPAELMAPLSAGIPAPPVPQRKPLIR